MFPLIPGSGCISHTPVLSFHLVGGGVGPPVPSFEDGSAGCSYLREGGEDREGMGQGHSFPQAAAPEEAEGTARPDPNLPPPAAT